MDKDLCRTLALGSLIRGYFHNLKGTLQSLSLQLQILYMKKDQLVDAKGHTYLEKALSFLQKLQTQLDVALEDANNNATGPWDLREIMEKELIFWEANLFFKHKTSKEILENKKAQVNIPISELKGYLCLVGEILYPNIKENTNLKIVIDESPKPVIVFQLDQDLEDEICQRLKNLSPLLEPKLHLEIDQRRLAIYFHVP
ncbi:MAG: hypothetical protein N2Z40_04755 [Caldimicrobium sp.]|nr:hypothetical protein [Caldimicrobium sp.]MCX7613512.1 hypothetical protein [Caldimicrobium sp.]MDW8182564.1 hypothetical protein [Caldimicrobium sp.]